MAKKHKNNITGYVFFFRQNSRFLDNFVKPSLMAVTIASLVCGNVLQISFRSAGTSPTSHGVRSGERKIIYFILNTLCTDIVQRQNK